MADKTYINGSAKAIIGQYGEFFNISFKTDDLKEHTNEKGYINITMSKRKEPGQYGDTHYFTLNDWKPEQSNSSTSTTPPSNTSTDEISVEDLPF